MLFLLFTRLSDLYRPVAWPVSLNQVLVIAVLTCVLLRRQRLVGDRGLACMVAYAAAIVLSSLGAADRIAPIAAAAAFAHDVIIVFLLLNLVGSFDSLRLATWVIVAAGAFAAVLALVHAWTGLPLGSLAMVDFGNLAGSEVGYRAAGTIGNSNAFAQMLVCALPFALYRLWGEADRRSQLIALVGVLVMTSALVLTYSRGGGIALLGALGLTLVLQRFRAVSLASIIVVLAVAALTAPSLYWNRVGVTASFVVDTGASTTAVSATTDGGAAPDAQPGGNQSGPVPAPGAAKPSEANAVTGASPQDTGSLPERVSLWKVGLLMFADHPLIGVGKNNYLRQYPTYASRVDPTLAASPKVAHSTPIQILADTGMVGLTAFSVLVAVIALGVHSARRIAVRGGDRAAVLLIEPIEVALFAYAITSIFQSDDYPRFLWILLALAMAARRAVPHRAHVAGQETGGTR